MYVLYYKNIKIVNLNKTGYTCNIYFWITMNLITQWNHLKNISVCEHHVYYPFDLLLLLLLQEVGSARLGDSDLHPSSQKTPKPHNTNLWKERRETEKHCKTKKGSCIIIVVYNSIELFYNYQTEWILLIIFLLQESKPINHDINLCQYPQQRQTKQNCVIIKKNVRFKSKITLWISTMPQVLTTCPSYKHYLQA